MNNIIQPLVWWQLIIVVFFIVLLVTTGILILSKFLHRVRIGNMDIVTDSNGDEIFCDEGRGAMCTLKSDGSIKRIEDKISSLEDKLDSMVSKNEEFNLKILEKLALLTGQFQEHIRVEK